MKSYKSRIADKLLVRKLAGKGAVLIEGPKWCGKTTTAEQIAKSIIYLADPEFQSQHIQMADINPKVLLEGNTPRLIDEWQIAPKLWDAVRFEVDHRADLGQFILTGSAVPANSDEIYHSGTGRFAWLTMRPMSLFESGESNGSICLKELFDSPEQIVAKNMVTLEEIAFLICRGGWPQSLEMPQEIALEQAFDYFDAVVKSDISRVDGVKRNSERVKKFLKSYSRNQGTQISFQSICNDMINNDLSSINEETVSSYVYALKKIFVIEDVCAWNPNLRSKTAIRLSDTRYFVDSSIATAALGLGPKDLIGDLNTMGLFFETLCIRDLRVYADSLDGNIYHYRDKDGLECDAVIHLRNGNYGLIEIKLGGEKLLDDGDRTLLTLSRKIDTTTMKAPSFLMILTGTGKYAMRRKDGVYVVPIGCLKD